MKKLNKSFLIVGGGLTGLSAAIELEKNGASATIIEADSRLGGRLKTDIYKGFQLDRGFQVLLTSYPEVKKMDIKKNLMLKSFNSGALVRSDKSWLALYNPIAHPLKFLTNLKCLSFAFMIDFLKLTRPLLSFSTPKKSTINYINKIGFSNNFKNYFIKPFFSGVFLESRLDTLAVYFQKYLRFFTIGRTALPQKGMEQIPKELFKKLNYTKVLLDCPVLSLRAQGVSLSTGDILNADAVILAVSSPALSKLGLISKQTQSLSVVCLYYSVPKGLLEPKRTLYLGSNSPINNLCFPSIVQPSYAPDGYDLISVSIVDSKWQNNSVLNKYVEKDLANWFEIDSKKN